jgi:hypothetical protein
MKRISSLFIALLFILVAQSVQAAYIPIDIPTDILNSPFTRDYLTIPPSTLGGIPFDFHDSSFFAFNDAIGNTQWTSTGFTPEGTKDFTMTMLVQPISSATTAYFLLNTNWGTTAGNAGMVTFFTKTGAYLNIILTGNYNIRDWNSSGNYTNDLTAANATPSVFSVTPNSWGILKDSEGNLINPGSAGRIDMLTVDLTNFLKGNEFLTSIVFTDYGSDENLNAATGGSSRSVYASHIRVEGVTIESVPEPSTLLLLALGLCVLGFVRTRFNKA